MSISEVLGIWWVCLSCAGVALFGAMLIEDVVDWIRERRRPDDPE